jgi:hypothetical protein
MIKINNARLEFRPAYKVYEATSTEIHDDPEPTVQYVLYYYHIISQVGPYPPAKELRSLVCWLVRLIIVTVIWF